MDAHNLQPDNNVPGTAQTSGITGLINNQNLRLLATNKET